MLICSCEYLCIVLFVKLEKNVFVFSLFDVICLLVKLVVL